MYLLVGLTKEKVHLELYSSNKLLSQQSWLLKDRLSTSFLRRLISFLKANQLDFSHLKGLGVFSGPAGFTDLRVIHVVANTLAYSLKIPIVSSQASDWQTEVIERLLKGEDDRIIKPFYGQPASTTKRKK